MSKPTVVVYPRSFTSVHAGYGGMVISKGDLAVDLLYGLLIDRAKKHTSLKFRLAVLDAALRLFGDFDSWVTAQRANTHLVGFNAKFLDDTLRYIATGERELRHENWIELMSDGRPPIHLASVHPHAAPRLWQSPSTAKILQQWCSHPNGVEDLLSTLHLLFGRARS